MTPDGLVNHSPAHAAFNAIGFAVLPPESMNGYADQFGGSDYP